LDVPGQEHGGRSLVHAQREGRVVERGVAAAVRRVQDLGRAGEGGERCARGEEAHPGRARRERRLEAPPLDAVAGDARPPELARAEVREQVRQAARVVGVRVGHDERVDAEDLARPEEGADHRRPGVEAAAQAGFASARTKAMPGQSTRPAVRKSAAAAGGATGSRTAPASPRTTTTEPKIGMVSGLATSPTSDTWWKWKAVSGAVPTSAQGETSAAAESRARHDPAAAAGASRRIPHT